MKQIKITTLIIALGILGSCEKAEIQTYNDSHYVQFTRNIIDTLDFSFFFYPGQSEVKVALPVKLVGKMPEKDLSYSIVVVDTDTDAPTDIYALHDNLLFRRGIAQDTAHIIFKNHAKLRDNTYKLTIEIKETADVKPGQSNYKRYAFKISDKVTKPTWWDANMDRFYLGVYSEKKFRAFMDATGVGDLSIYEEGQQRIIMLQFKYHLIELKDKGTPLLMEDGTDMLATVPLVG
ncbi:DUF4843 domain-containing protein [Sphingobacterium faecale]|uniref:DUF4843 domain-containing protein n=1 Tax=Sphingobacterium faecale TaxID=2803775 RepID=A0ABS1R399_9SPHI|nr:DUF4843 domain-containing protein [Sphingobacterium faecale]MBL1409182.1 DUF4843 domain-containing protein [Sphingobacterium faecale]